MLCNKFQVSSLENVAGSFQTDRNTYRELGKKRKPSGANFLCLVWGGEEKNSTQTDSSVKFSEQY